MGKKKGKLSEFSLKVIHSGMRKKEGWSALYCEERTTGWERGEGVKKVHHAAPLISEMKSA